MKLCQVCGQPLAEAIGTCPSCGSAVVEGRRYIDDYRIVTVLHEGYASFLCQAVRERTGERVMIRLFTPRSGVDERIAGRLRRELEELKNLPSEGFVRHHAIRRSEDGLWYRISEWVDALNWGELIRSGRLRDSRATFKLFSKIAARLQVLHESGHIIPHLILDDIMVVEEPDGNLDVKIDYKFSRFFDPKLDRPGPMLKHLLDCHPDILQRHPLDQRSDIWSLGKIFVELLASDLEIADHQQKAEDLPLPENLKILVKTMLSDDPGLRPSSMKEVAEAFGSVTDQEIEEARKPGERSDFAFYGAVQRIRKRQAVIIAVVVLFILTAITLSVFSIKFQKRGDSIVLEDFANRYAGSVAFVLVDYWLKEDKAYVFRNRSEGTAFLIDKDGYLLTNRHVACPWLEDAAMQMAVLQLKAENRFPQFGYRIFLWFEGEKAFNRSAGLIESPDLSDAYFLETAFRSDGTPGLTIAGVAKAPTQIRHLVSSPLRDDFAVLKIEKVPNRLIPLPLSERLDPLKIPKLSPVIALGFPLGSRTQQEIINVSVARGDVRRSFPNLIQIDASIYSGNSGGPVIDVRGRVIGIVSGVATDRAQGMLPFATPLWNLGMVLPITKAEVFIREIKAGQVKWNAVIDLSVEDKLKKIFDPANRTRWAEAAAAADEALSASFDPQLVMAAGMMHFLAEDRSGAGELFEKSLSMEPENSTAKFMLFLIDWLNGSFSGSRHYTELKTLDWRSPAELYGYLVNVLAGTVDAASALVGWETQAEKSWLFYVSGLVQDRDGNREEAEKLLKDAVLAGEPQTWPYYLSRARLDRLQQKQLTDLKADARWAGYQKSIEAFTADLERMSAEHRERKELLDKLNAPLQSDGSSLEEKIEALEKIIEAAPENGDAYVSLVFYNARTENWEGALKYARGFLKRKGRESARRLKVGLFEPLILYKMGKKSEGEKQLAIFLGLTRDSWYRGLGEGFLGKRALETLGDESLSRPEDVLTLYSAAGFWAEGRGENEKAVVYYKKALESFLDAWVEFDFVKERINRLRRILDR
jgi:S1-C subfamily serine protease